ncbi:hypothetical protein ASO20_00290 [Mycoplasma sp. (ex Biomphalaria glabrata)]|uniref:hypothetical protein n=1 Tax=Mycoplasma sp. (ex Biomphalaria glabrata) TaxID=1749074 RepID=UPI00073A9534|nr:hypothetical protein [Mycoplasma sp. (ex Biomphalaria glabrata)]ALV23120.1 hypothetical protein ASO20_00290 [Mycoplasma sp. (ex Biomphalaria glabrata)]
MKKLTKILALAGLTTTILLPTAEATKTLQTTLHNQTTQVNVKNLQDGRNIDDNALFLADVTMFAISKLFYGLLQLDPASTTPTDDLFDAQDLSIKNYYENSSNDPRIQDGWTNGSGIGVWATLFELAATSKDPAVIQSHDRLIKYISYSNTADFKNVTDQSLYSTWTTADFSADPWLAKMELPTLNQALVDTDNYKFSQFEEDILNLFGSIFQNPVNALLLLVPLVKLTTTSDDLNPKIDFTKLLSIVGSVSNLLFIGYNQPGPYITNFFDNANAFPTPKNSYTPEMAMTDYQNGALICYFMNYFSLVQVRLTTVSATTTSLLFNNAFVQEESSVLLPQNFQPIANILNNKNISSDVANKEKTLQIFAYILKNGVINGPAAANKNLVGINQALNVDLIQRMYDKFNKSNPLDSGKVTQQVSQLINEQIESMNTGTFFSEGDDGINNICDALIIKYTDDQKLINEDIIAKIGDPSQKNVATLSTENFFNDLLNTGTNSPFKSYSSMETIIGDPVTQKMFTELNPFLPISEMNIPLIVGLSVGLGLGIPLIGVGAFYLVRSRKSASMHGKTKVTQTNNSDSDNRGIL